MGVPRGGNAHFKESVYELHKRESHGFSPSVSHRLDHEVSLQGAGRRVAGADTNDYPAGLQRTGRPDRLRHFVARTCPYVGGNPAASSRQRLRAARQGTLITSAAEEVPGLAQAHLGTAFPGARPPAATSRTMSSTSIFRSTNLSAAAGRYSVTTSKSGRRAAGRSQVSAANAAHARRE